MATPVTPEELRDWLAANGGSRRAAQKALNLSGRRVLSLLSQLPEGVPTKDQLCRARYAEIAEFVIEKKCSQREAATHFDTSQAVVSKAVLHYETETGTEVPRQMMAVSRTKEIVELAAKTRGTPRQIASELDVSVQTVQRALRPKAATRKTSPSPANSGGYSCPPIGLLWKAPAQGQASA